MDRHAGLRKRMQERGCRLWRLPGCSGVAETVHHLVPRGGPYYGDDVPENLIPISGSGTTGCHGLLEAGNRSARQALARSLLPEEWSYVVSKLGGVQAAAAWLSRSYFIPEEEIIDLYH